MNATTRRRRFSEVATTSDQLIRLFSWSPFIPEVSLLSFISLLNSLIERLKHACIDSGDYVHGRIQFFFGHPSFPCVRKAAIHSGIAEPHGRDREADKHLLALGEALDGMRISVECPKVGFFHIMLLLNGGRSMLRPLYNQFNVSL